MTPLLVLAMLQSPNVDATVRNYFAALTAGDLKTAAGLVEGGVYSDPARRLGGFLSMMKGKSPFIQLVGVRSTELGDTATATVQVNTFQGEESSDLSLRRSPVGWRIVPSAVDPTKPKLLQALTLGFVQPMVFLAIVVPIEAQKKHHEDLLSIKMVGTALMFWLGDHGDRFPKPGANLGTLLRPYLKDATLSIRLEKKEWLLNDALRGRLAFDLDEPSKTIMLYEAAGGKGLGNGGRKLIVFADGSAALADAARLAGARWTVKP